MRLPVSDGCLLGADSRGEGEGVDDQEDRDLHRKECDTVDVLWFVQQHPNDRGEANVDDGQRQDGGVVGVPQVGCAGD